ncbi:MAG: hypothetical protein DDT34_01885 [Firmicutes bacterium]|nr:hypothetical protein [Bacillota bacterium]
MARRFNVLPISNQFLQLIALIAKRCPGGVKYLRNCAPSRVAIERSALFFSRIAMLCLDLIENPKSIQISLNAISLAMSRFNALNQRPLICNLWRSGGCREGQNRCGCLPHGYACRLRRDRLKGILPRPKSWQVHHHFGQCLEFHSISPFEPVSGPMGIDGSRSDRCCKCFFEQKKPRSMRGFFVVVRLFDFAVAERQPLL